MPRAGAALIAISLLAACSNASDELPEAASGVVARHLDAQAALPGQSPQDDAGSAAISAGHQMPDVRTASDHAVTSTSTTEVEVVAADEIVRLLEREELVVLDVQTDIDAEVAEGDAAVVQVRVLYGTGRDHPTSATYRVDLQPDEGGWTVVTVEAAS